MLLGLCVSPCWVAAHLRSDPCWEFCSQGHEVTACVRAEMQCKSMVIVKICPWQRTITLTKTTEIIEFVVLTEIAPQKAHHIYYIQ